MLKHLPALMIAALSLGTSFEGNCVQSSSLTPAQQTAAAAGQARAVKGRVLTSTEMPAVRLEFAEGFKYVGSQDFILAKKKGLAVRFHESEVRAMGRTAYGVKAVTLDDETDEVLRAHAIV